MNLLIVGDSNLRIGATQLVGALSNDRGHEVSFVTHDGSGVRNLNTAQGIDNPDYWADRLAGVTADAAIVDLGINDSLVTGTFDTCGYDNYGDKITWLLGLLPPIVLWSNLPVPIETPNRQVGANRVNLALQAAENAAQLTLVRWAAPASSHPEYMSATPPHYSPAGQAAYAALVGTTVDLL